MGSLISSRRIYQTNSKNGGHKRYRRARSPDPLRSSINRPVLRLKVKGETLTREGITTTDGVSDIRKSTLRKLVQSNMPYEQLLPPVVPHGYRTHTPPPVLRHNLNPPFSLPPHTLPTPSLPPPCLPRRSHSVDALDSMIIIQYVENDSVDGSTAGSDSHLARLSYAKMSDVIRQEEHFGNITISHDGSPPRITPSTSLGMINVCQRIQDHTLSSSDHTLSSSDHTHSTRDHALSSSDHVHSTQDHTHSSSGGMTEESESSRSMTPDECAINRHSTFRRSRSTDALSQFHSDKNRRKIHSVSEDQVCSGLEWSLGESIMRGISEHGLTVFNIDNPTSVSEHEVNKAWPELKEKMRVWKSQHSLDKLGSSSTSEDMVFSAAHHNITITAH